MGEWEIRALNIRLGAIAVDGRACMAGICELVAVDGALAWRALASCVWDSLYPHQAGILFGPNYLLLKQDFLQQPPHSQQISVINTCHRNKLHNLKY